MPDHPTNVIPCRYFQARMVLKYPERFPSVSLISLARDIAHHTPRPHPSGSGNDNGPEAA